MIIPAEIPKADKLTLLTRRHVARGRELAQKQLLVHVGIIEHLCAQIRHRPETRGDTFSHEWDFRNLAAVLLGLLVNLFCRIYRAGGRFLLSHRTQRNIKAKESGQGHWWKQNWNPGATAAFNNPR